MKRFVLMLFAFLFVRMSFGQNFFTKDVSLKVDTITLHGTLTIPDKGTNVPVALIIAGSGPTDRNGNNTQMTNNCLKMLADSLASHGIASLRYDKRIFSVMNDPNFHEDSVKFDDFVTDAVAWLRYLKKNYKFTRYVVIGHSQGSLVAILAAQREPVDAVISIAGAGTPIGQVLKKQFATQPAFVKEKAIPIIDSLSRGYKVSNVPMILLSVFRPSVQPFLISWMRYDPAREIAKLNVPILIIQGNHDVQVDTTQAMILHKAAPKSKLVIISGMSHIMKNAPLERRANIKTYFDPDLPLNQELVKEIVSFIAD